jgi:hypothetical protein
MVRSFAGKIKLRKEEMRYPSKELRDVYAKAFLPPALSADNVGLRCSPFLLRNPMRIVAWQPLLIE